MTPSSTSQEDRTWTSRLRRWGLDELTPVLGEVLRPFGAIGGQVLLLLSPLLTTFMDEDRLDQIVKTLDDPDRLDQFLRELDREADR